MSHKGSIHSSGSKNSSLSMGETVGNEITTRDHHEIMAKHIVEKLVNDLDVGYRERVFVERLLFSSIKEMIRDLLREYENVVADKMHDSIKSHLEYKYKIELESKVNHSHAAHAKLSSFITEVEEKLITKEKE